jgi:hypothetical protein
MAVQGPRGGGDGGSFEILADLTDRLASTACLDRIATAVLEQIGALGFGMVWMARFDESTGDLLTIKELIEGRDATQGSPEVMLDVRRPIGRGFHQRRMINIQDPESLFILDDENEPVPPGMLALPRGMYRHLRGSPFVTGPLLGSTGDAGSCARSFITSASRPSARYRSRASSASVPIWRAPRRRWCATRGSRPSASWPRAWRTI